MPPRASICRGCGAELVVGASAREQEIGGKWGMAFALFAYFWVLGQFGTVSFAIIHMLLVMFLGYVLGVVVITLFKGSKVRFFRTRRHY